MSTFRKKLSKKKQAQIERSAGGKSKIKYKVSTIRDFDTGRRIRIRTPVSKSGILAPPTYSTLVKKFAITNADKKWVKDLKKRLKD